MTPPPDLLEAAKAAAEMTCEPPEKEET